MQIRGRRPPRGLACNTHPLTHPTLPLSTFTSAFPRGLGLLSTNPEYIIFKNKTKCISFHLVERESKREEIVQGRISLSSDSLPRCFQQPGLGWMETREHWIFTEVSHRGDRTFKHLSHRWLLPRMLQQDPGSEAEEPGSKLAL